ncbi:protein-export membrane protein, SecD/SecF family [Mesotoga prima MesG1.Ag.4.2]|uniref:Protein-export membrane protein SecF n=1 Tax=Mesotoga prima MesG1.Ag.4.2 TaxID=660470 RepID=I2F7D5_9BACT|nr:MULTISPECIES: protein translocase subunit SecF [Mesotoga]AFK07838.1 protein-export membrane protein, SecD/SecF family [Mesotoga prima MesG1.Ag.4.2]PIJ60607.1 preprotein translocase subunit SecF [Mesotoga sp. H07.pep.5.3]
MTFKADFVGKRKYFIALSLVLIVVSVIFIFTKGFNFGVDFTGGIEISVSVQDVDMTVAEMRELLSAEDPDFAAARIIKQRPLTEEGSSEQRSRFSIIVNTSESEESITAKMLAGLEVKDVTNDNILSVSTISGYAAQEIRGYAWIAVTVSMALLLLYITIRFKFSFGVGAILTLIHDVIIVLGFYSIFGIEFNAPVVASLLTLVGYSLNDTIVVYDRIRENTKKMRGKTIETVVNTSINDVIVRSINTSLTTFLAVLTLFIFSGEVLRPFAFGMLVGVVVGTYSSLYISSPVVIEWLKRSESRSHA